MKKEIKYCVIGGQYATIYYGGTPTLIGAKRLATKNMEYWDNWQGWHKPRIYFVEDTEEVITHGSWFYPDGTIIRVPKGGANPYNEYWN